ncbi:trace amine-associated receptor 8b-like [Polypterus senegalus]|uniref:trace amine-associated receptor 8b-like n=1 Tax=Polypterus senegalus TaxID=55291 RepID=UPI00196443DC|nr:trace amine-associated receptor 8b-like [Polypterus senegalus]
MRPKDFGLDYCYPNNNASCFRRFLKPELYLFLYIFAGFVTTVTICGNLLVIISVSHFKQLHTPSNLLVVSLAAADFLIGFFVMPFQFSAAIENCWYFKTFCSSYLTYAYILNAVSVANMVNISVDRYLAVYEPFFYSIKVTNNRMGIWILLCWFFMILYTLTFLYFTGADIVTSLCDGVCRLSHYVEWWIIHCVVMFILPFTLMICFYARVFIVAKTHAQAITDMLQKIKSIDRTKCFVTTVTICGNLLVIISVSHFKQLHTPSNLLVVSLAAADFLIGFFAMPFQFSAAIENCWTGYSILVERPLFEDSALNVYTDDGRLGIIGKKGIQA